mmetsp:Transcript_39916/g.78476  ORF Transcript_39916/g.78476 Transcript_39916/m.78476 type:complete len:170 (-) Transcript_39916:383-892(-)
MTHLQTKAYLLHYEDKDKQGNQDKTGDTRSPAVIKICMATMRLDRMLSLLSLKLQTTRPPPLPPPLLNPKLCFLSALTQARPHATNFLPLLPSITPFQILKTTTHTILNFITTNILLILVTIMRIETTTSPLLTTLTLTLTFDLTLTTIRLIWMIRIPAWIPTMLPWVQ